MRHNRIVVAMSGASGIVYGIRILELLRGLAVETHLVISDAAKVTLAHETGMKVRELEALADHLHSNGDIGASIASGSFRHDGMIVAPCSAKTLGEIAAGIGGNLISRAADVALKERRRLVLMLRESPLNLGHCRNMVAVTEAGGIIAPPVPAFYAGPQTLDDIVLHSAVRMLDLFGLDAAPISRWKDPEHRGGG